MRSAFSAPELYPSSSVQNAGKMVSGHSPHSSEWTELIGPSVEGSNASEGYDAYVSFTPVENRQDRRVRSAEGQHARRQPLGG